METKKLEIKKLVKDKRFLFASFLITWAAALQGHMMWLQRQDTFKQKFGTEIQEHDQEDLSKWNCQRSPDRKDLKCILVENFARDVTQACTKGRLLKVTPAIVGVITAT